MTLCVKVSPTRVFSISDVYLMGLTFLICHFAARASKKMLEKRDQRM